MIKTCPHCGGSATLNANYSYKLRSYLVFVKCEICGAQGKLYRSEKDPETDNWESFPCNSAIDAWNMRAEDRQNESLFS